ncbi:MAG: hypothetical protein R3C26_05280 [Calditrichia bacterium]
MAHYQTRFWLRINYHFVYNCSIVFQVFVFTLLTSAGMLFAQVDVKLDFRNSLFVNDQHYTDQVQSTPLFTASDSGLGTAWWYSAGVEWRCLCNSPV